MADKLMRAQVSIPLDNGLPEDNIVNTFYFDGDDSDEEDAWFHSAVMDQLTDFYQAIDTVLFPGSVNTPATVKIYDMRDATPRVPEYEGTIALTPEGNAPLPNEVALCLSFQAAAQSGQSQARRRGRIFLGPITVTAYESVASHSRPLASVRNTIATAASALMSTPQPVTGSMTWAVYSPTLDAVGSIDDAFNDVDNGWIDNAWDTQRRRGAAPTSRTTFS